MNAKFDNTQNKQIVNEGSDSVCQRTECMDARDSTFSGNSVSSDTGANIKSVAKDETYRKKMSVMPKIKWGDLDDDVLLTDNHNTSGSDDKVANVCGESAKACRKLDSSAHLPSSYSSLCDWQKNKLVENILEENVAQCNMPLDNEVIRAVVSDRLESSDVTAQNTNAKVVELDSDISCCAVNKEILDREKINMPGSYCSCKRSKKVVLTDEMGEQIPCAEDVVGSTVTPVTSVKQNVPTSTMIDHEPSEFTASVNAVKCSNDPQIGVKDGTLKSQHETAVIEDDSGESKERFRQRLWRFLFENLNRAIDELYLLCELECDIEQMKEATLVLKEASSDFKELISRIKEFENMRKSSPRFADGESVTMRTEHRRPHALSWEVRRMTTSSHKAEILSSSLEAFKRIQQERESMHAAIHVNIQVPSCAGKNCISVKIPTKLDQTGDLAESGGQLGKLTICPDHTEGSSAEGSQDTGCSKVAHDEHCDLLSGADGKYSRSEKISTEIVVERKYKNLDLVMKQTTCYEKDKGKNKNLCCSQSMDAWKEKRNWEEILSSPCRASSRISYSPSMNRKSTDRARVLHDKLMSPEKKKKSLLDLKRDAEQKHARAMRIRSELENERVQKLQCSSEKLFRVSEWQAVRSLKLREGMDARHQRSESRHEAFLAQVVRRAGDESSKVNEVRFITSLNEENKKLILRQKLQDSEIRRAERLQTMKKKQKEDMAREEAALERRKHMEAEKLQRLAETQRKKEEAQFRRGEERRAYTAAREAKAIEHQRRKEERVKAQQEEAQLLAQKLDERLDESERRRKFYLEQVRERASMDVRDQTSPLVRRTLCKEIQVKTQSLNSSEDNQVNRYSSFVGSDRNLVKKKVKKIRQRLMSLKYEFCESSCGIENACSVSKAYVRIARAKIGRWLQELQRARQARKEGAAIIGQITSEIIKYMDGNVPELHASRQAGLLDFISSALPASHTSKPEVFQVTLNLQKLLKVTLSLSANRSYFLAQNLLPPIVALLSSVLENYIKLAPSSVVPENCCIVTSSMPINIESISEVLDGFLWTVTTIMGHVSSDGKEFQMQLDLLELVVMYQIIHRMRDLFALYDRPLIEGSPFPSTILSGIELLKVLTSRHGVISSIDFQIESQRIVESSKAKSDGLQGCFSKKSSEDLGVQLDITSCCSHPKMFDVQNDSPPNESHVKDAHGGVTSKKCGTELTDGAIHPPEGYLNDINSQVEVKKSSFVAAKIYNENMADETQCVASLVSAISETGLVCLPSLLTAVLLQANGRWSSELASYVLPSNFQEVATGVLKVLNNLALMDITLIQSMLARPDLKMEIFHLMSFLLSYCTANWKKAVDQVGLLLLESLLLLGNFSLFHSSNQAVLRWGKSPIILHKLCDLPFAFFSDAELMPVLGASLVAACYGCEQNKSVVQQEISLDMLLSLLKSCRVGDSSAGTGKNAVADEYIESSVASETKSAPVKSARPSKTSRTAGKMCNSSSRTSNLRCQNPKHKPSKLLLHHRFPASFLDRAEQFFSHTEV